MLWMSGERPVPVALFRFVLGCRPRLLWLPSATRRRCARSRRELATLDDRLCDDIGITPMEAGREAARPVRDELSPWAPAELRKAAAQLHHYGRGSQGGARSFYHARGRGDLPRAAP